MDAWLDVVWFIVWGLAILAALGVVWFIIVASIALTGYRKVNREIDQSFKRGGLR